jgi:DNA repair exonuclease SbcCD ATPase subunit
MKDNPGLTAHSETEYVGLVTGMVDELDATHKDSAKFAAALEAAIALQVDTRARQLARAEAAEIVPASHGSSVFTTKIDEANRRIAELKAKSDGRSVEEHLAEIQAEDRKPRLGFFASQTAAADARIAELREQIAASKGKQARGPLERDDLHAARTKKRELTPEEKIARTRENLRVVQLKLQAYASLSKVIQGHIARISEVIEKSDQIDQKDVDKLNKFRDALEQIDKQVSVFSKKKDELDKEQQENLQRAKIETYQQLEAKIKQKREELIAAERAEQEVSQDKNYSGFLLPGKFLQVVKEEQQRAVESQEASIESDIQGLASQITQMSRGRTSSAVSSALSTVSQAQASQGVHGSLNPEKEARAIEEVLLGDHTAVRATSTVDPASTPITPEVAARKAEEAKNFDPDLYAKKKPTDV